VHLRRPFRALSFEPIRDFGWHWAIRDEDHVILAFLNLHLSSLSLDAGFLKSLHALRTSVAAANATGLTMR
jgi:hypothetical protein